MTISPEDAREALAALGGVLKFMAEEEVAQARRMSELSGYIEAIKGESSDNQSDTRETRYSYTCCACDHRHIDLVSVFDGTDTQSVTAEVTPCDECGCHLATLPVTDTSGSDPRDFSDPDDYTHPRPSRDIDL